MKKSQNLLLALVLSIPGFTSILFSYINKKELENQLLTQSADLNKENLTKIITNYSGTQFFYDFLSGEYYSIYLVLLLLVFGFFITHRLNSDQLLGIGNYAVVRQSYQHYVKKQLKVSLIDGVTIVSESFIFIFLLSIIIGKGYSPLVYGDKIVSSMKMSIIFLGFYSFLMIFMLLVVCIALLGNMWLSTIYITYLSPLIVFLFFPIIIVYLLSIFLPDNLDNTLKLFIPFNLLNNFSDYLTLNQSFLNISLKCYPLALIAIGAFYIYKRNLHEFSETYL